jgi:oligoendopeptidase F
LKVEDKLSPHKERRSLNYNSVSHQKSRLEKLIKQKREKENPLQERESLLTSPTSLSMMNSFLINTIGKSLDSNGSIKKHRKKMEVCERSIIIIETKNFCNRRNVCKHPTISRETNG